MFCVDRNGAAAEETVDIITGEGGKATAFTADVSRAGEVEAMVAACLKAYGRIDVLDNNVGIAEMGSVVEVTEAEWDRVFAVNLKSAFLAMKHVIPVMEKQGGGSIINISSIASIRHLGISYVSYGASKAAMNQMTRTTAVQFARDHVRVNCHPAGPDEDADGASIPQVWRRAMPAATSRRCGAPATRRCRWAIWATPGTSPTPRCFWRPTNSKYVTGHRARGRWRDHLQGDLSRGPGARPGQRFPLTLLREGQDAAGERMPGRRHADRPVQKLHRHQRDAAIDVDRMRAAARAPVMDDRHDEQQIGDDRRCEW